MDTFAKEAAWLRFLRQYSVDHYVIDFYSPELKLAVELDGAVHEQPEQKQKDVIRQRYLENFKITFVHITNEEFMGNSNKAFKKIEDAIKEIEVKLNSQRETSPSSPL